MSTIAFIGLGIMGSPMACHLAQAGHTVIGYNRSPEKTAALVAAGGRAADRIRRRHTRLRTGIQQAFVRKLVNADALLASRAAVRLCVSMAGCARSCALNGRQQAGA